METTVTVTDIRAHGTHATAMRDDEATREALFFHRLALRVAAAGAAVAATCGWLVYARLASTLTLGLFALLLVGCVGIAAMISLLVVRAIVTRAFLRPAAGLIVATERIADGDFVAPLPVGIARGAIARLTRAMSRMMTSLRHLTNTVRTAARETTQAAQAITSGGAHMAATAEHIANTSNDLSRRAGEMAQTIDALVDDAGRLVVIATELTDGAQSGVARNAQLRALAQESSTRLTESTAALDTLAADAHSSAAAVEELAHASEEIQTFVTLVTKMARQSKLLALNAAMEAARAGEQGQGFAVVANEVRRLAASSTEAAERTEALVKGVLAHVAESRAASARAASTVDAVRSATQLGLDSFRQVEEAARDAEHWIATIERAATQSGAQVSQMNGRLEALAEGTARFTAAMEEVAAASQEQSASTEEIAAAGHELLRAAGQLEQLTATYRTEEGEVPPAVGGAVTPALSIGRDARRATAA